MDINEEDGKKELKGSLDISDVIEAFERRANIELDMCSEHPEGCLKCNEVKECILGIRKAISDICGVIVVLYRKITSMAKPMNVLYENLNKEVDKENKAGDYFT